MNMFDIIDKTTHKFEIINNGSSLMLETITCNSTSYQNWIFQNKIYYFGVSKIAILNDDHETYHSSLLNIEKKNLAYIFLKIYLLIILNVINMSEVTSLFIAIVILFFPDLLNKKYIFNYFWDVLSKSYKTDVEPIKDFFIDIDSNKFDNVSKKEIITTYFGYGFSVLGLFITIIITSFSIIGIILSNVGNFSIITVNLIIFIILIILVFEIQHLLSHNKADKEKLHVYNSKLMFKLKIIIVVINLCLTLFSFSLIPNS
jgi:hypothetical protein